MKFKLDENFGLRAQHLFLSYGHEVQTVRQEGMAGETDLAIYQVCCVEGRCLVTLDRDFGDVTRFAPEKSGGIVVIRLPKNPTIVLLEQMVDQFLQMLVQMSVERQLWVVEPGRIRVHQSRD